MTARTAELHNANLMSDVDCAMHFARAAFDASAANVDVNHRYITDAATVAQQRDRLATLVRAARDLARSFAPKPNDQPIPGGVATDGAY